MKRTNHRRTVLLLAALAVPGAVAAADDDKVRVWAASCAACHGTNGVSQGGLESIAGRERAKLLSQLKEFKAGTKPATVMHQHAKGYTDEELERLAEYFSRQKP